MTDKCYYIYIISDSAGETASKLAQAAMSQYATVNVALVRKTFVSEKKDLVEALERAKACNAIIIHTMISPEFVQFANQYCQENDLFCMDILSPVVNELSKRSGIDPTRLPGAMHSLNQEYFNRIAAMEFAVKYDDGKDPKGFLEADIVLLGVSRTSKTPLSLFLANKNLKVANLPLIPQAHIPKELWEVNPKKIVGLTNNPEILNKIRQERMKAYGLNPNTAYSDINKINEELAFANKLYEKLGCLVINVADLSIEETASIILQELNLEEYTYHG
ncbi:kinase/pyrophosphorylase [Vagococcus lutrae]|uniref:Putative pyruvate, phosphate dikinase regulatory protein n=1 Tax=Vagococcus lutrae TaxID=81947 RepID=A0AAF0BH22_9ENTE|nr:pyruvate, water dikinase regulatory protein [Vagococcus lutrae]MCO7150966.1 kinase/pyrophosphorylase [Vagococcus lutrae]MDT2800677.1 kinase/pyrophosphorylase [Vagococcus lutrae]MDT2805474.1 kinase/pyrophosphorylase [Vagococcus lutrae]MDT2812439.1 kinase/pyrophosphorylase [Vagococcus lutrae]MDT2816495.1 kinase/pyrophosphorylase [Vagococcus lutrae]